MFLKKAVHEFAHSHTLGLAYCIPFHKTTHIIYMLSPSTRIGLVAAHRPHGACECVACGLQAWGSCFFHCHKAENGTGVHVLSDKCMLPVQPEQQEKNPKGGYVPPV